MATFKRQRHEIPRFARNDRPVLKPHAFAVVLCSMLVVACAGADHRREGRTRMQWRIEQMFQAADVDHDEWLSPTELQTGFPWLAGKFEEVDTDRNGKVSLAELQSYIELQSMQRPRKR